MNVFVVQSICHSVYLSVYHLICSLVQTVSPNPIFVHIWLESGHIFAFIHISGSPCQSFLCSFFVCHFLYSALLYDMIWYDMIYYIIVIHTPIHSFYSAPSSSIILLCSIHSIRLFFYSPINPSIDPPTQPILFHPIPSFFLSFLPSFLPSFRPVYSILFIHYILFHHIPSIIWFSIHQSFYSILFYSSINPTHLSYYFILLVYSFYSIIYHSFIYLFFIFIIIYIYFIFLVGQSWPSG